ncbi:TonB-dependent receptor [Sphingomonas sp. MMS24-JH45]
MTQAGLTFLNAIPVFSPPDLDVKEAFGEVRVPLVKDVTLLQELSLDAAARYTDYSLGNVGGVWAYNVGGIWSPVRGLRIRGTYARSVRAPTQSDLFAQPSQTFLLVNDPCGQQNINNNPNRTRNCAAAGVPTTQTFNGVTEAFTNRPASSILGLNGSNPNLAEERGTSWTLGAVFQPEAVPGLALTVDYYNITVDNVIFR